MNHPIPCSTYFRNATVGVAFLVAGNGLIGCAKPGVAAPGATGSETQPTTAKATRQNLVGYVFFDGKVVAPPDAQAVVYAPYDLPVSEVLTAIGKRVGSGETIVKLSMPSEKASIDQAKANLSSAESTYAASRAQNQGPVSDARRAVAEARAAEVAARQGAQGDSGTDLATATEARVSAEADLRAAIADMNAKTAPDKLAVDAASQYLRDARAGAKLSLIKSPISGTVVTLTVKPGDSLKSRQAIATVVDLNSIQIQGVVPPELVDKVKKGTPILIALNGPNSDPLDGQVVDVNVLPPARGQKSPGYLAVISFDNSKGIVLPTSTVKRLGLRTGKVDNALVVPVGSVTKNSAGKSVVQVQKNGSWVETAVELGLSDGAVVEVKSGVSEGDVVRVAAAAQ